MLVDININKTLIDNRIESMKEKLNTEIELKKVIESIIEKLKGINDIENLAKRIDIGIYEGYLCYSDIKKYCGLEIDMFDCFNYVKKYPNVYDKWKDTKKQWGTCDNIEQVFNNYPELIDRERKFFIIYHKVDRVKQSPNGGFRYEKNGEYIGTKNPTHEYLYDDKHIDFVLLYYIYELLK